VYRDGTAPFSKLRSLAISLILEFFSTLLGDTWRDQEHEKFAQEFDALVRTLRHFHRSSEEQIPVLIKKAEWIDGYLGHR
jgi:hypothetical protein